MVANLLSRICVPFESLSGRAAQADVKPIAMIIEQTISGGEHVLGFAIPDCQARS
jgi:hypothetical protein